METNQNSIESIMRNDHNEDGELALAAVPNPYTAGVAKAVRDADPVRRRYMEGMLRGYRHAWNEVWEYQYCDKSEHTDAEGDAVRRHAASLAAFADELDRAGAMKAQDVLDAVNNWLIAWDIAPLGEPVCSADAALEPFSPENN